MHRKTEPQATRHAPLALEPVVAEKQKESSLRTRNQPEMNLDFRLSLISIMTMSLDLLRSLRSTKQEHIVTTHTRTILTDFTARTSGFRAARAREGTVVVDTGGAVKTRSTGTSVENCDIRHETYVTG